MPAPFRYIWNMSGFFSSLRRPLRRLLPRSLRGEHVTIPVVRLAGTIGVGVPFSPGLTLSAVAKALERAFAVKDAPAVALLINSPGGSPVQSHLIYRRIRALAEEKQKHVFAFVEDAAASGGYMIACAADEIFADPCSIVGSIGVVTSSFGFDKAMTRLGIERRLYTAGENKATLDPFSPQKPEDVARLDTLLKELHGVFIELVRARRDDALEGEDEELFSGAFWLGTQAVSLGLVDGLGDVRAVLRQRYGEKVELSLVEGPSRFFLRRPEAVAGKAGSWAQHLAQQGAAGALAAAEERALWARLGL
ncbi:S49 family peptidase [Xanthobacter sp. TB0139]|uniref:S49 family peptidase n=1 Tax=Xanthobacter sp. TB0139 TaxID=3459178 RepID=UPI004039D35C